MEPDILGNGFERMILACAPDEEGEVCATLVRHLAPSSTRRAVLYIHGYNDYFFQEELARQYLDRGYNFYAVDLRKYGRSRQGHQTWFFCRNISDYFEEIDAAVRVIREDDRNDVLLLNGHSTGGLIAPLYAHHRRKRGLIDGLFLNSPFLDMGSPWHMRVATRVIATLGRYQPYREIVRSVSDVYGASLHSSRRGEWNYDLEWKPLIGPALRAGWVRAIYRAQEEVHRGLQIPVPVLLLSSDRSASLKTWDDLAQRADIVLDVRGMDHWAPKLGPNVTRVKIEGGMHDLALSAPPVRAHMYQELFRWAAAYLPQPETVPAAAK